MVLGPSGNINHHDGVPAETQSLWEIGLVFCFEVFSDLTFLPPLLIMHRHRRHFELYIGVFQLATGFLYNFCNALNVQMFLTELQWHAGQLSNPSPGPGPGPSPNQTLGSSSPTNPNLSP